MSKEVYNLSNPGLIFVLPLFVLSLNFYPQKFESKIDNKKTITNEDLFTLEAVPEKKTARKIKEYKVVETVNMRFGGYKLSYIVSNKSLIRNNNLGTGNTRVVTPIYAEVNQPEKEELTMINSIEPIISSDKPELQLNPTKLNEIIREVNEKSNDTAYINLIRTYERVIDKGYKSVELLMKVADANYFTGNLKNAAKYYEELFSVTSELEPEYYYRFSKSLKFVNKEEKAAEMMGQYQKRTKM